jgi:hypothetical protein
MHEKGAADYIRWGQQKFKKTDGFENLISKHLLKGRKIARVGITHELSLISGKIVAFYSPIPVIMTDNFIFIRTFNWEDDKIIAAYLNSSVFLLTYFILRREKTGALGQIFGTDMRNFYCLNPKKINFSDRQDLLKIFDSFVLESENLPPIPKQIKLAIKDNRNIKYQLDRKICEIISIENVPEFLKQVYQVLNLELKKFN